VWRAKPEWAYGLIGAVIGLPTIAACIAALFWFGFWWDRAEARRLEAEDAKELGAPDDQEVYVGASYLYGAASLRQDTAWDRGFLQWNQGWLRFRGFGPSFVLPAERIRSASLQWTPGPIYRRPRAIIEWKHPDGSAEFICLQSRGARSRRDDVQRVRELVECVVQGCREGYVPADGDGSTLPFRSTDAEKAILFSPDRAKLLDKVKALAVAVPVFFVALALTFLIPVILGLRPGGGLAPIPLFAAMAAYYMVLLRAQKRDRSRGE